MEYTIFILYNFIPMTTKAKQIADQYNSLRWEWREKLQALFDEKNKKRKAIKELFGENPEEMKKQSKAIRSKLNAKWKEENADLIIKYQELYTQKKLDDATFPKGLEESRKLNPEIDEKSLKDFIMGKTEKKELKETITKSLEFEKDTFKIDSKGWKEATDENDPISWKFVDKWIRVKVNPAWDVVEYLEDKRDCKKWEQIFIDYDNFLGYVATDKHCSREEVEKKYLMTKAEFKEKMKDKPYSSEAYKKFFNEEVKDHLTGYWDPGKKTFYLIGEKSDVWLAGGYNASFIIDKCRSEDIYSFYGFSGRLLKN